MKIINKIKLLWALFYKALLKLQREVYKYKYHNISSKVNKLNVKNINDTISSLIDSNKSISRFGDGEIRWAFGKNKHGSFEKPSPLLQKRLLQVLDSNRNDLEIGLPNGLSNIKLFTKSAEGYWKGFLVKYWKQLSKHLSYNKTYYNANITRFYIDFKNKKSAKYTFNHLKKIWNNKKLLIIEGKDSRLGVGNDLFSNAENIKRIECPPANAFEKYENILSIAKDFLSNHNQYLTLIALGPTATVLAYDLSDYGYRSIDIGQVDLEYEWFLCGAKKRINIPSRYVNSVRIKGGREVSSIDNNNKYKDEIYTYIN